ncbi:hypothetical protein SSBR45G_40700 [Bradyrhizobium sp. SSBR45G]|uniref:COG3904 family protein n=1 Tax=unclassified Bradyrhizobium TaxID=2631580 RepID=UPI0023428D57|nr:MULTISPECIES: hypothetical protein [unclassified Bradyrhizobium]GLH79161.1 hypothetical protein SSBR45G_40700 [Bradyrhizobium sp. SSBR45G]GLH84596.1 hypothetical protein SSBR45R_20560 [Bradyrhizobium sp. SSBR45R]
MASALNQRLHAWLAGNPDESILRWVFRTILVITVAILAADLIDQNGPRVASDAAPPQLDSQRDQPDVAADPPTVLAPLLKRLMPLPKGDPALEQPISLELRGGGRLYANGTITPGSARTLADEVERHGEYIRTIVLNSPGGSVADALAMGRLIRARKFATEVEAGKTCASSCPLVFAGGIERRAGERAVIGVHQIAAIRSANATRPGDDMSLAQNISARCQRHLADMGIDLKVWVHAMETPHDQLFTFKPDELKALNLVTSAPESRPEKPRT